MSYFSRESFFPFEDSLRKEWLAVNGLGGFSALSLTGAQTRYYHGLLIASLAPPVRRYLLLANLRETITTGDRTSALWCARMKKKDLVSGLPLLHSVETAPVPVYTWRIGGGFLTKTILPVYGTNAVYISYHWDGGAEMSLELEPLCTFRDYHGLEKLQTPALDFTAEESGFKAVHPEFGSYTVRSQNGQFNLYKAVAYEKNLSYLKEVERGFKGKEILSIPGKFVLHMQPGQRITITAQYGDTVLPAFEEALVNEQGRQREIVDAVQQDDPVMKRLALAADKFLVRRSSTGKWSLLAGFPWFSDWGRDTMISLPGIALCSGRYDVGKELLETFAASESEGLLPNRFSDYDGDTAEYNTVDASLWFFVGVLQYLRKTGDSGSVREKFLPVMDRIIKKHIEGTLFNIKVDPADGLLSAGEHGIQLTWMDAKVDGIVITPRHGKSVEINALWYNALKIRDILAGETGFDSTRYAGAAKKVRSSYLDTFWNHEANCLYDVVHEGKKDDAFRPNQLFAICLPFPLLEGDKAKAVLDAVTEKLLTPYGLRSLEPVHREFKPVFSGNRFSRDSAYHQGTVWSWLIGPYVFSRLAVFGDSPQERTRIRALIAPLIRHMDTDGIDCISENFDGLFPAEGKGCFHQAWSIAELLRILDRLKD